MENGENQGKCDVAYFGRFRLSPGERRLERDGEPVQLHSRAFDILHVLVEQAGRVVGQRELISRVWLGLVVEETNLRVQICTLAEGATRRR
jgi:DNA-binding winged helix-turn-helix (wHTH) protein